MQIIEPSPRPPIVSNDKWVTLRESRALFTEAEKIAIYTAAETSPAIRVWLDDWASVQNQMVNKVDPDFIAGVNAMEFGGLIGAGRAQEILA